LFGASTGAAAALGAAASRADKVAAVVSRGGRPDLLCASCEGQGANAVDRGRDDNIVIELNQQRPRNCRLNIAWTYSRRKPSVRGDRQNGTGGESCQQLVPAPFSGS